LIGRYSYINCPRRPEASGGAANATIERREVGVLKSFDYFRPSTVKEATEILADLGRRAKVMAGGTDLLVNMRAGELRPDYLVDLQGIGALGQLKHDTDGLKIGAAVTLRAMETDEAVRKQFGVLAHAAAVVGSVQIRNLGTIGGNICNASPSADMAPPLLVLNARARIAGAGGRRSLPLADFFVGPGRTALEEDEILIGLDVPAMPPRSGASYLRVSTRRAMDLAVVGVAALVVLEEGDSVCREARIALGSVAPTPIRAREAEKLLKGKTLGRGAIAEAAAAAVKAARPISDVRGTAEYRREMVEVLTRRALAAALKQAAEKEAR